MAFTDLFFLFFFLPVVWALYRLVWKNNRLANLYILIVSLIFYAWGSLKSLFILLFVLLWNYVCTAAICAEGKRKAKKTQLMICVAGNLLVLFVYKYLNVWLDGLDSLLSLNLSLPQLVMPVGLSFYMFSCLSYVFDVYYGKAGPLKNIIDYGVYAAFFGRVNMGPIAHYARMKEQLFHHPVSRKLNRTGAALFLQGLFMKVILADNLALIFQGLSGNTSWLGNLLLGFSYFFQLYFDFAGYSRMARGIGAWFGFEIPMNFHLPYTALSVQDFWRRWHISLTDWFRDYVYIPLGGNRVGQGRWIFNILCVWALTGLWHGATWSFIIWGLYQGILILLEKFFLNRYLEKAPLWLRHLYLVLTQLIGWTWFSSAGALQGLGIIGRYFFIGITSLADTAALFYLKTGLVLFVLAAICSTSLPSLLGNVFQRVFRRRYPLVIAAGYLFCFAVCIAFMVSATNMTFLYAAF